MNHAKELADRLYNAGNTFVEAKSSILNDEIHQTYKVSVDTVYILDLTQSGCTRDKLYENDCDNVEQKINLVLKFYLIIYLLLIF